MADPRFFKNAGPMTLARLAEITGATLSAPGESGRNMADVAPLDVAQAVHVSFIDNIKYRDQFTATRAGACFAAPAMAAHAPAGLVLLLTDAPYRAYALAAQAFYPDQVKGGGEISPRASIHPTAKLGAGVTVDDFAVIGEGVEIGTGSRIGAHASISHAIIGNNTRIYPGCRIGQDGFGFAIDPKGHVKVPQLGRVVIGNNVEIGANSCIDRGAGPDTVIGDGTWIDNLVQIGHNVRVGRGCVIVSQVGISGSTVVDDYVVMAGQAGIAGHLHIGRGARIGAQAGVMRDVAAGSDVLGSPAGPIREKMREFAMISRLVKKDKAK
jgi:UDP-3-O-[3-hydroxymyristoyl] glucosamine N-acyltransferase